MILASYITTTPDDDPFGLFDSVAWDDHTWRRALGLHGYVPYTRSKIGLLREGPCFFWYRR